MTFYKIKIFVVDSRFFKNFRKFLWNFTDSRNNNKRGEKRRRTEFYRFYHDKQRDICICTCLTQNITASESRSLVAIIMLSFIIETTQWRSTFFIELWKVSTSVRYIELSSVPSVFDGKFEHEITSWVLRASSSELVLSIQPSKMKLI